MSDDDTAPGRGTDPADGPGGPLRLLLTAARPLLGDLLRAQLETRRGMTIVGPTVPPAELAGAVRATEPDVVVCAINGADAFLADRIDAFVSRAPARVLAVFDDGRRSSLWELRPHRTPLGEFSTELLLRTLATLASRRG